MFCACGNAILTRLEVLSSLRSSCVLCGRVGDPFPAVTRGFEVIERMVTDMATSDWDECRAQRIKELLALSGAAKPLRKEFDATWRSCVWVRRSDTFELGFNTSSGVVVIRLGAADASHVAGSIRDFGAHRAALSTGDSAIAKRSSRKYRRGFRRSTDRSVATQSIRRLDLPRLVEEWNTLPAIRRRR